jgi:multiple sugar transport system permease protein
MSTSHRSPIARRAAGVVFVGPALVLIAALVVVPLGQALYFSFTDWDGTTSPWVGLDNYARILTIPSLSQAILNSALLLVSVPFGIVGPFLAAYLLSSGVAWAGLWRALIFMPAALSWVVIGVIMKSFLALDEGGLNSALSAIGLDSLTSNWLASPAQALVAVVITFNLAVFGTNTVVLLAGFATLDRSMLEAARMDGASPLRVILSIVLPLMRRFVQFVYIISVIASFTGLFALIFTMTSGGPGYATTTLEYAIWEHSFSTGEFGVGSAMGVLLMAAVVAVIGLGRLLSGRREDDL